MPAHYCIRCSLCHRQKHMWHGRKDGYFWVGIEYLMYLPRSSNNLSPAIKSTIGKMLSSSCLFPLNISQRTIYSYSLFCNALVCVTCVYELMPSHFCMGHGNVQCPLTVVLKAHYTIDKLHYASSFNCVWVTCSIPSTNYRLASRHH